MSAQEVDGLGDFSECSNHSMSPWCQSNPKQANINVFTVQEQQGLVM